MGKEGPIGLFEQNCDGHFDSSRNKVVLIVGALFAHISVYRSSFGSIVIDDRSCQ